MKLLTKLAKRFVAGETADEAIAAVRRINRMGIAATLDHLGENIKTRESAVNEQQIVVDLYHRIAAEKIDSNVSIKLTALGLDISEDFCFENVSKIAEVAANYENFLRIDMEGSDYTQKTLNVVNRLAERYSNVGTVIQSALKRSLQDIRQLNQRKIRVRLCKGAYKEPPEIAYQKKTEIKSNFDVLADELLENAEHVAIATHDEDRIHYALRRVNNQTVPRERVEFQMLYGLRGKYMEKLAAEGFQTRIYIPFGTAWMPYFIRRLRERKENVFFVLANLFKK